MKAGANLKARSTTCSDSDALICLLTNYTDERKIRCLRMGFTVKMALAKLFSCLYVCFVFISVYD